jgi:CubicO group peptidase (beta-lactamase class C family)
VPTLTGKSFYEFTEERLFKPLRMDSTSSVAQGYSEGGKFASAWHVQVNVAQAAEAFDKKQEEGNDELPSEMFGERKAFQLFDKGYKNFGPGPGHILMPQRDMVSFCA